MTDNLKENTSWQGNSIDRNIKVWDNVFILYLTYKWIILSCMYREASVDEASPYFEVLVREYNIETKERWKLLSSEWFSIIEWAKNYASQFILDETTPDVLSEK